MYIRTKSIVKDPSTSLVTIEEELVGDDGKVKKSQKLQMKEYSPRNLQELRKKAFGKVK